MRRQLEQSLAARGLPGYAGPPENVILDAGEGDHFEEKFYRDVDGYTALFRAHLGHTPLADTFDWDLIIPVEFEGLIELPATWESEETTTVCSAHRVLAAMEALATVLGLPPDVPRRSDNLDITDWFDEVEAGSVSVPGGRWREDLDAAFHVAVYLRGAEFSVRRLAPLRYV